MRPGPRTWGRDGVAHWKQNWLRCELSTLQFPSICLQLGHAKTSMDQRAPTPWSDTARAVHKLTQPERSGQYNPDVRHRSQTLCPRRSSTKKRQRALENIGGSWRSWVASSTLWACLMHPKIHLNVRATPPLLRRLDAPMVAAKTAGLSLSLSIFFSPCVCVMVFLWALGVPKHALAELVGKLITATWGSFCQHITDPRTQSCVIGCSFRCTGPSLAPAPLTA